MAMWLSRLWRKFAAPMKPKKGGMTPSGKEVDYEKMRDYIGYEFLLRCSSNFEEACLVVRRCLHHGLLGMIFIIILTFVSYLGKLRYFIADEYKTSLCKWLLGRDEDGTGVTTVSIVNYLNDKYDLSKQTEENFPDVNKHNIATNAQVLILASKLAYEDMQKWRFVVSELWKMEWVAGYSFQPQEFIKPLFSGQAGDVDRDLIRRCAQEGIRGISDLEIANLALAASEEKKLRDSWWTVTSEESEGEGAGEDSCDEKRGSGEEGNSEDDSDSSKGDEPEAGGVKKHKTVAEKVKPAAVSRDRTGEATISEEEIADIIQKRKETEGQRITADRLAKMDIGDGNLTGEEKEFIAMTLRGCDKAIAFNDSERGRIDPRYAKAARIHTVPHVPWKDRPRWKYAQKEKEEIVAFIKEKIRTFVVEPCESAYSNKWFFLRKGGSNKLRWIQNLQRTNAVTIRDVGSIPEADLLVEGSAGRSIYSICDLFSGYDEIPLDYRDRHMTAMHTPLGLVQMMVVPMGWTNGVAVFQRAMIAVLKEFIPEKVEIFLDDFPIKGPVEREETEVFPGVRKFVADHMNDVRNVLEKLDDANLTVSGTKSRWGVSSIKILGFICDKEGRRPDPEKLVKLMTWPSSLKSITEVRQFLGVVGYWRIFIKAYGEKVEPLRRLLRKSEGWVWGEEQAATMEALKEEFREGGEVLGVPFFEDEEHRPFIVSTDAGPHSVGGLLSQKDGEGKERPLRFESRTLNPAERNYSQFKKEVLGVLHCLKAFRHYLYGRRFLLRVDPTAVAVNLQKDFSLTDPTIARWMIHIRLYDYRVERISGAKNQVADGLSRLPIREEDLPRLKEEAVTMAGGEVMRVATNRARVAENSRGEEGAPRTFLANLYDGKYRDIGLYLAGRETGTEKIQQEALGYCLRGGHLFKRPTKFAIPMRVLCDLEERRAVIEELHDGVVGGHRGVKGTFDKVRGLYRWDGQYTEVEKYCSTCEACQKRAKVRYKEPLVPSLPTVPGEKVHVDLVTMPKGVGGLRYIINVRDDLTGFVEAKAIKKKTAEEVSDFLLEYIARYGVYAQEERRGQGDTVMIMKVFIFKHKSALVVALRGTEPFNIWDWLVDLDARMIRATDGVTSNPGRERLGYMHFGFFSALMQPESPSKYKVIRADGNHQPMASSESAETLRPYDILRKHVLDELRGDRNLRLFVTGHSLGGALACVFSAHLFADIDTDHVIKPQFKLLCTFGQPRTGGTKFALYMDHLIHGPGRTGEHDNEEFRYLRFVNNNDIVPRIPPPVRYSHSTQFVFLNEFGYEEIDTEMNGLEIFRVIVGEVASFFRRSTEFITNLPMDLVNRDWRRPLLRLMVIIIPSLIYDHFPHEYERVVRRRPDPYFDEDYWGTKQERSGIVQ
ncbi:hypothetical protein CBR_g19212 [Chara braunii]|uniref:Reverse transcriptase domain-containing protein n=1 Tax=Chara braunii TaxID=69332 RepID=A0A388JTL8_CHABU|nr:hypothetical protein CBR_g19212 [Chara braunii]|eukprot:GBG61135.1 hypothetical protein CBR_g19212 [Chara braunii]